ncbi:hypothetical protein Tco_1176036 [Tanacetum coccineum]
MASDHVSSDPVPQCPTTLLEQDSLSPEPQSQEIVPQAAETVTTSNELDLLFSLMFDELLNGTTPVVSKSSAIHAADHPNKRQHHNTTHYSTTIIVEDAPPLNIQTTPQTINQEPTQEPTVIATENIIQAETNNEYAQDELAVKRLQEELELSEAQKKRMVQVQEAAKFYTEEDWDTIRAKLEANADLVKEIAREDISEADYAQRMMGLISQRRKLIAEQKAKAQRDKPMTQAQQRQYTATYLKNQGGWKLAQIKKLIDEELKENFEYLMRSMQRFVPMDTEKESRKRTGVELQIESSKKLKSDTREDVSVPKEKDKEKGLQKKPESAKSGTEEDIEAYIEERVDEPSSEEFPMGSIPQGPTPAKIGDLKTMFDPPSEEDAIWKLPHQQQILNWRYFHSCSVHCLTVEAAHIYMLTEVKYPLPPRVCKAMLEKKLLGDRKDEIESCLCKMELRRDNTWWRCYALTQQMVISPPCLTDIRTG